MNTAVLLDPSIIDGVDQWRIIAAWALTAAFLSAVIVICIVTNDMRKRAATKEERK